VVGNTERVGLGPIDEAYAIQRLAETHMRQVDIARKMGINQSEVSRRLRLLELPADIQRKVNQGEIAVDLALLSLAQPEGAKRDAAIRALVPTAISDTDVRVDENFINADGQVRNSQGGDGEAKPERRVADKAAKPRTVKQMRVELEAYATPEEGERTKAQVWLLTKLIPTGGTVRHISPLPRQINAGGF